MSKVARYHTAFSVCQSWHLIPSTFSSRNNVIRPPPLVEVQSSIIHHPSNPLVSNGRPRAELSKPRACSTPTTIFPVYGCLLGLPPYRIAQRAVAVKIVIKMGVLHRLRHQCILGITQRLVIHGKMKAHRNAM